MEKLKKHKILFFTPYGGFTGSEMSLYYYLSKIDRKRFDVQLFSLNNGELIKSLKQEITVYTNNSKSKTSSRVIDKIKTKAGLRSALQSQVLKIHKDFQPDLWFLNTMMLNEISELAIKHKIPYTVYFHELDTQYGFIPGTDLQRMCEHSKALIGCSEAVCNNLKVLGNNNVLKQYECIDVYRIDAEKNNAAPDLIQRLKSGSKAIIGMSGQRIGRKGFDLFIKTAEKLKNHNIEFVWLGARKNNGYDHFLEKYIIYHQINNIHLLTPANKEYYACLNSIDLFFLSSVEDPFPLVMLEAAYLNKYIVAFDSGGVSELLEHHPGKILKSHDPEQVAGELSNIVKNKEYLNVKHTEPFPYSADIQVKHFEQLLLNIVSNS